MPAAFWGQRCRWSRTRQRLTEPLTPWPGTTRGSSGTTAWTGAWARRPGRRRDGHGPTPDRGGQPRRRERHARPAPRVDRGADAAHRPMVDPAAGDRRRAGAVHHLLDVPRLPERALLRRALHLFFF